MKISSVRDLPSFVSVGMVFGDSLESVRVILRRNVAPMQVCLMVSEEKIFPQLRFGRKNYDPSQCLCFSGNLGNFDRFWLL